MSWIEVPAGLENRQQPRGPPRRGLATLRGMPSRLLRWLGLEHGLLAALEAEQDRWFLWSPILVGAGIGIYFWLPKEPGLEIAAAAIIAAIGLRLGRSRGNGALIATGIVLCVALGFAAATVRTWLLAAPVLARDIGQAEIKGWIEDVEPKGKAWRVTLRVAALGTLKDDERPFRVRVRVQGSAEFLRIGRPVRVRAKLSPPPIPALPGDYDFARRAYFQRLGAVGFARSPLQDEASLGAPPWTLAIWAPIENVRRAVSRRINQVLTGDQAAIAIALIQGDQGAITERAMNTMRDSGLAHILSISGLHMAIAAGAIFWVVRALLALSPAITQLYPVKAWAAIGASIGAFLYLLLSGCQVPAVRSFLMIELMFLAMIAGRPALSLRNVALAALLLLLIRPESLHDVSFLMSFAATAGLVALYEDIGARKREDGLRKLERGWPGRIGAVLAGDILTSVIAGLAVAPLGAYYFHKYQQYSVLGNLLALPIVSFWLMPLVLIVMLTMPVGLDAVPLVLLGYGVDALLWVGVLVASIPGAITVIPAMPVTALIAIMMGALWFGLWRKRWRWLGLVPLGLGLGMANGRQPPDVLVGRDGAVVAARLRDDKLIALPARGTNYELARWLEHDGDKRTVKQAATGEGFRCDGLGCTAKVKGRTLSVVAHPAALSDDCARADIIIVRFPRSGPCPSAKLIIDLRDIRNRGAHAIFLDGGAIRVVTVSGDRGDRPWSRRTVPQPRKPFVRTADGASATNGTDDSPRNQASRRIAAPASAAPASRRSKGAANTAPRSVDRSGEPNSRPVQFEGDATDGDATPFDNDGSETQPD